MADKIASRNKTTANNLDNPQENRTSVSAGGSWTGGPEGRSDKTNSVDEEDRPKRRENSQEGARRFASSDDISGMTKSETDFEASRAREEASNSLDGL